MSPLTRSRRFLLRAALFKVMATAALAVSAGAAVAATLEVRVDGLRNGRGVVRLAVFASPKDFLERGREFGTAVVPAAAGEVTVKLEGLPAGTYALSMFHDENDDDSFDQAAFGLPLEGFGFSNNPPVLLSAPSFKHAAFEVSEPKTAIAARMRYWTASSDQELPSLESDAPPWEGPEGE